MKRVRRLAVLADIHGNLPALEAVLRAVESAEPDVIVLAGDLVDGPFPAETLNRLDALTRPTIWLRGNGDRWLAETADGTFEHPDGATDAMLRWASAKLTPSQRMRLAQLPLTVELDVGGLGTVGICHATARSDNEMFLVDSSLDHARSAFGALAGDCIVIGHSHMPFDRLFDRRRIVNAGSVGIPYGHSGASWLLIDQDVVLKRTSFDAARASALMLKTSMPNVREFVDSYVLRQPSDAEALLAFRATRERQQGHGSYM